MSSRFTPKAEPDAAWPQRLKAGDQVALVSPAGPPDASELERGVSLLESWRLRVTHHELDPNGYLAGKDDDRFDQLRTALETEDIRAVLCTRGGYGSQRLVERLVHQNAALSAFVARRAVFVGFSDITALHTVLNRAGLVTFYGPPLAWASRNGDLACSSLQQALFSDQDIVLASDPSEGTSKLTGGAPVSGRTTGGNLTMVSSSVGTPSAMIADQAVVVLEESGERPLEVDRLLTQLIRSRSLTGILGFAIGQFESCLDDKYDTNVVETLRDRLACVEQTERREIPVVGGLPVGHGNDQRTLPLGARATLDPAANTLTYERNHESA